MTHTLTQMIHCIVLSCAGALPAIAEPLVPSNSTGVSAGIAQVRDSVANIYRSHDQIRQRIQRMERALLALEHEIVGVDANNYRHPPIEQRSQLSQARRLSPLPKLSPAPELSKIAGAKIYPPLASETFSAQIGVQKISPEMVSDTQSATHAQTQRDADAAPIENNPATTSRSQDGFDANAEITYDTAILDGAVAMNESALNEMRGGFITSNGLQISFGIERAVYINGNLVTTTSLNIVDLTKLATILVRPTPLATKGSVPEAAAALAVSESMPLTSLASTANSSTVATQPAAAVAPSATTSTPSTTVNTETGIHTAETASISLPGNSSAQTTTSGAAPVTTPVTTATTIVPPSNSTVGSLAVIQSGDGNSLPSNIVDPSAIGTVIQNSLDNQKIQTVTVVNASVNSLEVLKTLNLQSAISASVANSLKR